jgi:hypothetical protein
LIEQHALPQEMRSLLNRLIESPVFRAEAASD